MKSFHKLILVLLAAAVVAPAAFGDSVKPPTLSGKVFAYFGYDLTDKEESYQKGANEFGLGRCYINVKGALTEKFHYRVTADIGRDTYKYYTYELYLDPVSGEYSLLPTAHTKTGQYNFYAKYAYVDIRDVIPYHKIYGGLEATPWIGYEDKIWSWRVVHKSVLDHRKWDNSADLGVGFKGKFGDGLVEHHLTLTNGAGYKNPEGGLSGKAASWRLSVFPLASNEDLGGLSVNAYVRADNLGEKVAPGAAKDPDLVYGGLLGLKHEFVNFGAGYFMRSQGEDNTTAGTVKVDGNALTAYATGHFRATEGMTVHPLVRYDMYEPDGDTDDDERTLLVGGVGLKFFDGALALIPNYQTESYKSLNTSTNEMEDKSNDYFYLHAEWNWK